MASAEMRGLANEIKKARTKLREKQKDALLSGDMEKQLSVYIRLELIEAIAASGTEQGRELLSDEETELCKKIRKEKITDVLMYLQRFVKATVKEN